MRTIVGLFCVFVFACSSPAEPAPAVTGGDESTQTERDENTLPPEFPPLGAERPEMSAEQCVDYGAEVVGDIGDGSTHRSDYVCPSGEEPIGTVPVGIEGAVCCPL
ncbi:MAG: hypothetical protein AB8H86_13420 [Polyangiales bacterium]